MENEKADRLRRKPPYEPYKVQLGAKGEGGWLANGATGARCKANITHAACGKNEGGSVVRHAFETTPDLHAACGKNEGGSVVRHAFETTPDLHAACTTRPPTSDCRAVRHEDHRRSHTISFLEDSRDWQVLEGFNGEVGPNHLHDNNCSNLRRGRFASLYGSHAKHVRCASMHTPRKEEKHK